MWADHRLVGLQVLPGAAVHRHESVRKLMRVVDVQQTPERRTGCETCRKLFLVFS